MAYRIISWLCCATALGDSMLVASDVFRHHLPPWTTGVTLVVASFFAWIGLASLGIERNLSRLHRCSVTDSKADDWQRCWKRLHLFLLGGMLFVLIVMLVGLTGILSRIAEGKPLFG